MTSHLTIEALQEWVNKTDESTRSVHLYPRCNISNDETVNVYDMAKQLLATMQREAKALEREAKLRNFIISMGMCADELLENMYHDL